MQQFKCGRSTYRSWSVQVHLNPRDWRIWISSVTEPRPHDSLSEGTSQSEMFLWRSSIQEHQRRIPPIILTYSKSSSSQLHLISISISLVWNISMQFSFMQGPHIKGPWRLETTLMLTYSTRLGLRLASSTLPNMLQHKQTPTQPHH